MARHVLPYTSFVRFALAAFLLMIPGGASSAARKDSVLMKNGDHLTGEVKKLENGILYIDLNYVSGSIGLDWSQVDRMESTGVYQITLQDGTHLVGTLQKVQIDKAAEKNVAINAESRLLQVPASEVVDVESQQRNFWRQLRGNVSLGASYTSGNSQTALNSDDNVNYRAKLWAAGASYTSSFSGQSGSSETNLQEVQAAGERYFGRNSFVFALSDFLHSSQQQLNLRSTLGGAYGEYWVRTNEHTLRWFGGIVYTHEDFQSGSSQPTQQNVEGLVGAQYELFYFDRYALQSQLLLFPGLSDFGRIRATTKSTLRVKLRNNFSLSFSLWDNYDSRPPVTAKKNELGVSTNVGWTF
jgi:putative salt-induced outer membrane protein YdiY